MEKKIPTELDWVNAFSACSLDSVFQKLKLQVAQDVKARNAQFDPNSTAVGVYKYKFEMTEHGDRFAVALSGVNLPLVPHRTITFALEEKRIAVTNSTGRREFDAYLTLNDEGECRVKIDDAECELWQLRRRALQKLFFETI